jgi:asparaginyl-tRNA synthetase
MEFLRKWTHLRLRSQAMSAMMRIRHSMMKSLRCQLEDLGCLEIHTPILTSVDCEGAGETFRLDRMKLSDVEREFFDTPVHLTVSAQLHLEAAASAFKRVYTLAPAFRAENSDTSRHLAEFWMLEAEFSFLTDLAELMTMVEQCIKRTIDDLVRKCSEEIEFFEKSWPDSNLGHRLRRILDRPFLRMDYQEAISSLQRSSQTFSHVATWASGLQSEHEKYLAGPYSDQTPVFIVNYPKHLKAFYMRENDRPENTVAAMDLLVPFVGELAGGSLREERSNRLRERLLSVGSHSTAYEWYLDLREYGTVPHGGFGLGIERFLRYVTAVENVRDTIAFPRHVHHCLA